MLCIRKIVTIEMVNTEKQLLPYTSYSLDIASISSKVDSRHGFLDDTVDSVQEVAGRLTNFPTTNRIALEVELPNGVGLHHHCSFER
jgi:hypothetical protein